MRKVWRPAKSSPRKKCSIRQTPGVSHYTEARSEKAPVALGKKPGRIICKLFPDMKKSCTQLFSDMLADGTNVIGKSIIGHIFGRRNAEEQ
jgi:hypothetical protein